VPVDVARTRYASPFDPWVPRLYFIRQPRDASDMISRQRVTRIDRALIFVECGIIEARGEACRQVYMMEHIA